MKLTPGVNFSNILRAASTLLHPKSVKMIDNLIVFFMLLGSECVKAVSRTLMKLSPEVNFTNMLCAALFEKISKEQKDSEVISVFLRFWDNKIST
jgi:hypothetical protein